MFPCSHHKASPRHLAGPLQYHGTSLLAKPSNSLQCVVYNPFCPTSHCDVQSGCAEALLEEGMRSGSEEGTGVPMTSWVMLGSIPPRPHSAALPHTRKARRAQYLQPFSACWQGEEPCTWFWLSRGHAGPGGAGAALCVRPPGLASSRAASGSLRPWRPLQRPPLHTHGAAGRRESACCLLGRQLNVAQPMCMHMLGCGDTVFACHQGGPLFVSKTLVCMSCALWCCKQRPTTCAVLLQ